MLYEVDLQQVQIHLPTLVLPFLTRCCEGQEYIAQANEPRMKISLVGSEEGQTKNVSGQENSGHRTGRRRFDQ